MQNLNRWQTLVDFAHESFQENNLRKADGQMAQVTRKSIQVIEIMELHSIGKVKGKILEVVALVSKLIKDGWGDQLTW